MVIRVVRMSFKEEKVQDFISLFNKTKNSIRDFDGCLRLDLLQDFGQEHILTTYSYWQDLKSLDKYRHSPLFLDTWAEMKEYFSAKPIAFSCKKIMEVPASEGEKLEKTS